MARHCQCLWECSSLSSPWLTITPPPPPPPPEFCRLLDSWYTGLSATISSSEWSTASVPLRIGVYQGDPLSVAIFLTVMNTLSDTLCSRKDLGFPLPSSNGPVNHLLYADDACIVSSTPAGCQHLLDMVQRWLE